MIAGGLWFIIFSFFYWCFVCGELWLCVAVLHCAIIFSVVRLRRNLCCSRAVVIGWLVAAAASVWSQSIVLGVADLVVARRLISEIRHCNSECLSWTGSTVSVKYILRAL